MTAKKRLWQGARRQLLVILLAYCAVHGICFLLAQNSINVSDRLARLADVLLLISLTVLVLRQAVKNSQFCHCGLDPQSPDLQFEILNQVQNDGFASYYTAWRTSKQGIRTTQVIRSAAVVLVASILIYNRPWVLLLGLQAAAANLVGTEIALLTSILTRQAVYSLCIMAAVAIAAMQLPQSFKTHITRLILLVFCSTILYLLVYNIEVFVIAPLLSDVAEIIAYLIDYEILQLLTCALFYYIVAGFMGQTRPLRAFDRLAGFASGSREPGRQRRLPLLACLGAAVLLAGLAALVPELAASMQPAASDQALPLLDVIAQGGAGAGGGGGARQLGAALEAACYAFLLPACALSASRAARLGVSGAGAGGLVGVSAAAACLFWLRPWGALPELAAGLSPVLPGPAYAALAAAGQFALVILVSACLALALYALTGSLPKRMAKAALAAALLALAGAAVHVAAQALLLAAFASAPPAAAAASPFVLGALGMLCACPAYYAVASAWAMRMPQLSQ